MSEAGFDPHAERYRQELAQGLMLSGESSDYFLRRRLERTRSLLAAAPAAVLDFGCGVGDAAPVVAELFPQARIVGTDISVASLALARERYGGQAHFVDAAQVEPDRFQLAYCNGVFHHIPVPYRPEAMAQITSALQPGGVLAFWDNSPWSLAARWVMSRIPFDHDAVMVWPRQARELIEQSGMVILRIEFHFIWPRMLGWLRPTERWVRSVPLGAQYLVLARKPP